MEFPVYRPRRLRQNENFRRLIKESRLSIDNLIMPYFVTEGKNSKRVIKSMPGVYQLSVDNLVKELKKTQSLGIPAVLLFGIPERKDEKASGAYDDNGVIQKAIKAIKDKRIDVLVVTDVCLCEYTSHGHCGVIKSQGHKATLRLRSGQARSQEEYVVDNDATLELLAKMSLSHAQAGVDMVAPSSMMDGQVKAIRQILDENKYQDIPIMAYSAKYVSSFYGPFREAAHSAPSIGDRKGYQMDSANSIEALREIALDVREGADIIMVKPGLGYQDIIYRIKEKFALPLAVYNVSGEYSMVKAASGNGWLDEKKIVLEILTGFKRAGADIIITYWANDVAKWI